MEIASYFLFEGNILKGKSLLSISFNFAGRFRWFLTKNRLNFTKMYLLQVKENPVPPVVVVEWLRRPPPNWEVEDSNPMESELTWLVG